MKVPCTRVALSFTITMCMYIMSASTYCILSTRVALLFTFTLCVVVLFTFTMCMYDHLHIMYIVY